MKPFVVVAVAFLALTGCAAHDPPPGAAVDSAAPGPYGGEPRAVHLVDASTLSVDVGAVNADGCPGSAVARVEESPGTVWITTTYEVGCSEPVVEARASLAAPLGERDLVVDQRRWAALGDGSFRQCDELLGCDPRPAACDAESYLLAVDAGDFPRNGRSWDARACEHPWLVLDVHLLDGRCAFTDEATERGCEGRARSTRWVMVAEGPLWQTVGTLPEDGGCGAAPPAGLPVGLCADLPPLG